MIIGGSASQKLAAKVAAELNENLCPIETFKFPDGERYLRIRGEIEEEAVVIQSTGFPQDENLIELFLIIKTLKSLGVKTIKTVIPYFGYGRQEKRFKSGEAISAQIIANLLELAGTNQLFCVNLHENNMTNFFNIPVHEISAIPFIAQYLEGTLEDPIIIAPDKGALDHAQELANLMNCDFDYLEKIRISPEVVETKPKNINIHGKSTVIIDDIISTGGTIVNASKILKNLGAEKIIVACVHPVMVDDALIKIFASGVDDVIATDTLRSDVSVVSLAPLIADALKK
ncbi:MAG: ribose-phosphate diphosphokinase [Methanobacteriaceae archaeon]|nr:ribose-phosphate diphosphokinase [Methanobacteriaceae archaeon]